MGFRRTRRRLRAVLWCQRRTLLAPSRMARALDMVVQPVVAEMLPAARATGCLLATGGRIFTDDAVADTAAMNRWIEDEVQRNRRSTCGCTALKDTPPGAALFIEPPSRCAPAPRGATQRPAKPVPWALLDGAVSSPVLVSREIIRDAIEVHQDARRRYDFVVLDATQAPLS